VPATARQSTHNGSCEVCYATGVWSDGSEFEQPIPLRRSDQTPGLTRLRGTRGVRTVPTERSAWGWGESWSAASIGVWLVSCLL
jgi:hypothetical protein